MLGKWTVVEGTQGGNISRSGIRKGRNSTGERATGNNKKGSSLRSMFPGLAEIGGQRGGKPG